MKTTSDLLNDYLNFVPKTGSHSSPNQGMCAMEYVAFLAGEPHSDNPPCSCDVLAAYVRPTNDHMPDEWRVKLRGYLARLIGSRDPASEQARAEYLAWQAIRVFAPIALRKAGLEDHAVKLETAQTRKEATAAAWAAWAAARAADAAAAWAAAGAAEYAAGAAEYAAEYAAANAAAAKAAAAAVMAGAWQEALDALDGALAIGKQGSELPYEVLEPRVTEINKIVEKA